MLGYFFKKFEELLLPDRTERDGLRQPIDVLQLIHQRLVQLAQQLVSHAELAPYPQVTTRLRHIAREKEASADRLKKIIEKLHGTTATGTPSPAMGKNHWQRLIRDLEDQKALDDLLSRYDFMLGRQVPEVAEFLRELKTSHEAHRRALTQLIAVADPQATQT
jgi:rubrerythrin